MRGRLFGAVAVVLLVAVALSGARSPAAGQAKPAVKKLDFPHVTPPPESSATAFKWMSEELTKRSGGALNVVFHGGTLLTKELEIMDAVKSGNVAIGNPAGAACTVFPEMCVFLTPFLVRDYNHAYAMFNGEIGRNLDETFQKKYKVKVLFFYAYGFRHFWNNRQECFLGGSREAQAKIRQATETVDNFQKAREILEPKGMKVNQADVASFRKIAEEKIWPQYRQQYADMWDRIVNTR